MYIKISPDHHLIYKKHNRLRMSSTLHLTDFDFFSLLKNRILPRQGSPAIKKKQNERKLSVNRLNQKI